MTTSKKRETNIELIAVFLILAFCEWFFFRNILGTGKGALIGDRGDGRLTTLLAEHWWKFFTGKESFSEVAMFYPAENVIGYTDLLLGYGIVHSVLRLTGLDMFMAYKWTLIFVHCLGTASMYCLLRRKICLNVFWTMFGTLAFSFSDTFARHLFHTQLGAICMLPILLILFIGFIQHFENRKKRNLYAYSFIAWFVLITYNSWYIAFFTGMFSLVFLIVYLIRLICAKVTIFSDLKEKIVCLNKDLIGYLIFMIVLYIPFIQIYLPVLKASSGYSYTECSRFLPEFIDIINVSESNWIFGWLPRKLQLSSRGYSPELQMGFSYILLALFIVFGVINHKKINDSMADTQNCKKYLTLLTDAIFVSMLACIAFIIKLSSNGASLWAIIYYVIPMAKSVRAVSRFLLWLSFPMAVLTAWYANQYIRLRSASIQTTLSVCAVLLIFSSNVNKEGASHFWDRAEEMNFLNSIPAPPEDAEVFYITDTEKTGSPEYIYQLDAFEIATNYNLKTINGYSGQFPGEWGMWNVCSDLYEENVSAWIEKYELTHVYAFDRAACVWIPYSNATRHF